MKRRTESVLSTIASVLVVSCLAGWPQVGVGALAAKRTISWNDGLCVNSVKFDSRRFNEGRVRNTLQLLIHSILSIHYVPFGAPPLTMPRDPRSVTALDLERTRQQCANAIETGKRLKLVGLKGIDDFRRARVAELGDWCEFYDVEIRGYRNASVLRDYKPAVAACAHFVDALEGKTDMPTKFRETVDDNCRRNVNPSQCVERALSSARGENGMQWAWDHLMKFGWHNCANAYTAHNADRQDMTRRQNELEARLRRVLKVSKPRCEGLDHGDPGFGPVAQLNTEHMPGNPAKLWNITAMGLFCGTGQIHPGKIVMVVHGLGVQVIERAPFVAASIDIDGTATELKLEEVNNLVVSPIGADLARKLIAARAVSVHIENGRSPEPDRMKLEDGWAKAMRAALRKCFKRWRR
jgi:hypothetical protein